MSSVDHIAGRTFHGRSDSLSNRFSYGVDYLLIDAEKPQRAPRIFARNRAGLVSLHDSDHGGAPRTGRGAVWVRAVLAGAGAGSPARIDLLAQPRVLGHVFNPVSFWLCYDTQHALTCVIAEVSNTFGDRHSYLCHTPDFAPIAKGVRLTAQKIFHVSPFQPIEGRYVFDFDITPEAIAIRIDYTRGEGGLIATLSGPRKPLTNAGILKAILRRPFGSRRVLALIHWQAVKLWWKGATFRPWTKPPVDEVS